ncbi:sensor histidine kinase [Streptomyces oceani]|uniref:histidine kinase n=1 Tax=Streptomyces oceani TaxID=1075402 RepID=A0A1E7KIU7_9ACTN|nr:histidine kinase [Streptomyces oceani]OEV03860.1 histidine kinase [Streptomyces oceani]
MRRSLLDWTTDIGLFLLASAFAFTASGAAAPQDLSPRAEFYDLLAGGLGCAALFLRRRWPVPLAVTLLVAGTIGHFFTGPIMVALFTVASRCQPRLTAWVAALAFAPVPVFLLQIPGDSVEETSQSVTYFALVGASLGWGLYRRSRRELIRSLRDRAERAGEEARRQAREDIAREMHDVLAHRLSLLSVHAGALEFNPGAAQEDVRRAAGVIRDSAHQALEDMREIIGVLRSPTAEDRPQPDLTDLPSLVAESRAAGTRITLDEPAAELAQPPALTGRTAYRVVQEALTNARKHAPQDAVILAVGGAPGEGLTVRVSNPATAATGRNSPIPGAGQGLIGLAERVRLVGGTLEHAHTGDSFRLDAWLPWPA